MPMTKPPKMNAMSIGSVAYADSSTPTKIAANHPLGIRRPHRRPSPSAQQRRTTNTITSGERDCLADRPATSPNEPDTAIVVASAISNQPVRYDICVLTGDYRGETFGPFEVALDGVGRVRSRLKGPIYGVLGNHDTIRMVPGLEAMGIRMLLNECEPIARDDQRIFLAGVDDAHFYRMDNIEKAVAKVPEGGFSILLSHTPEIYRQAAHAHFRLMLSGHTHGGQLCLPGSIPIMLEAVLPRRMGAGAWQYHGMTGYTSVGAGTSVVPVRLNCPPEITLHCLRCG